MADPPARLAHDDPLVAPSRRSWMWVVVIIAILVAAIVLHLTGVLGARLHS